MKQRFTKRTRLVSALLTLAMVFTFLPFSAFAATVQVIEELAFTTHGCDALQITEGGSIADWITAFRKKMEKTGEEPINATSGYGFYVKTNYNDWFVADEPYQLYATETGSFQSGETYYLCVPIRAAEGYFFNTARDFKFKKITVDGEDLSVVLKKPYPYADANNNRVYIPLSFKARHSPKIIYGKDATCITSGVKEHYKCQKCGKLFMDYACTEETTPGTVYIKPTKIHRANAWNKTWSRHYKLCKVCGIDFDTAPHSFTDGKCTVCELERHDLNSAEVEVTEPAAGMTPAMIAAKNVTTDKKTAFSTACTWYEADSGEVLPNTDAFAEGKQYRAELKLTARADWQFLNSTIYKINGTAAEKDSSSDAAPWEQVTLSRIFTAKPATEGKVITNIQMTIPAPVAGNSPSSCKAQKSDPRYTIRYRWAEVDAAGNTITHEVTTFEEGKHYRVTIVPEPNTGYEFEDGKQDAIINGKAYSSFTSEGMNPKRFKEYSVILTAVAGGGSTGGSTGGTTTPEAGKYQLTVTDGFATVNGITSDVLNVKPGDTVTLTADTTKFPENEEFGWWEITPYGSVSNTLTGQYQRTATFTMPNENVSARAMSKSAGVSTGGDDGGGGGGAAILLVGGAAVAGLVGYGVYSYVSEQQLKALLPEGVAMPENRAQTALLLWNTAGRPEPAEAPAFKDVADPDTAKAAQWCVEHGLMDQKLGGRFAPDNSDPAYKTLNAYQQLVG